MFGNVALIICTNVRFKYTTWIIIVNIHKYISYSIFGWLIASIFVWKVCMEHHCLCCKHTLFMDCVCGCSTHVSSLAAMQKHSKPFVNWFIWVDIPSDIPRVCVDRISMYCVHDYVSCWILVSINEHIRCFDARIIYIKNVARFNKIERLCGFLYTFNVLEYFISCFYTMPIFC